MCLAIHVRVVIKIREKGILILTTATSLREVLSTWFVTTESLMEIVWDAHYYCFTEMGFCSGSLLLLVLAVPYLYFGSAIMLVTYFVNSR